MNGPVEPSARLLCVGLDADTDAETLADADLSGFDVRFVATVDEARALLDGAADATDSWRPDGVVSAVTIDDADGLDFLRGVDERTDGVVTVLAPGPAGSERVAGRAVAAGISGYCSGDDSLDEVVRDALARERVAQGQDHSVDRRYRTLAENLPNGAVALYDRDLRYLVVGGDVFDDLPVDRSRIEGTRFADAHSPAFVDRYGPLYRAAIDGERSEFEFTFAGHTFRGHTVPVRDRRGAVVAGMALTQDVTEEREQRRQLERQNRRLDRFAGVVSHDLRTPLSIVEGSLDLLRDAARAGDVEAVDEHADRASRACRRMNDLVDDVLTLARHSEGVDVDALDDVPLGETTREVWETLDTADATLDVDTSVEDLDVRADPSSVTRLLENLLSNAVVHGASGPDDHVHVSVEWVDRADEGAWTETGAGTGAESGTGSGFAVVDDGVGLDAEARERLFDWGYTTDTAGVGLGLSIVQEIAQAHGWTVSVGESAAGGTRFEVRGVERVAVEDGAAESDD